MLGRSTIRGRHIVALAIGLFLILVGPVSQPILERQGIDVNSVPLILAGLVLTVATGLRILLLPPPRNNSARVGFRNRTLGVILTVLGGAIVLWVFARLTTLAGKLQSWQPPFSEYEIVTLLGAFIAIVLLIVGIVHLMKEKQPQGDNSADPPPPKPDGMKR